MSIKQIFADYNEKASEKNHVLATGYGIHTGSLFVVKDTNIHWGDPVNTASKLGEDLAVDGQVIITSAIKEAVEGTCARGCTYVGVCGCVCVCVLSLLGLGPVDVAHPLPLPHRSIAGGGQECHDRDGALAAVQRNGA